jgi:hypothetical protein
LTVFFYDFFYVLISCFELVIISSLISLIPLLGLITDENFYLNSIYVNYFLNNIYYLDKNKFTFFCFIILGLAYSSRLLIILITNTIKNNFQTFKIFYNFSQRQ